jgi:CHAT domain-containing protein
LQRSIVGARRWEYLPGTDGEAAYIKELYQEEMNLPAGGTKVVLLRGAAATEESVRKFAPQSYLLHISTHGFFAEEDRQSALQGADAPAAVARGGAVATVRGYSPGLLSGLVFAGANEPVTAGDDADIAALPDDGILTADEIASLPLGGAQLVVLSACETGLGESAGGEGLLGIQRAFQVAGARATIATLWKINDEATRAIMEEFYRNYLERHLPPLEALREAQRWALKHPELANRGVAPPDDAEVPPKRLPPQFWAAFTLSGDWR